MEYDPVKVEIDVEYSVNSVCFKEEPQDLVDEEEAEFDEESADDELPIDFDEQSQFSNEELNAPDPLQIPTSDNETTEYYDEDSFQQVQFTQRIRIHPDWEIPRQGIVKNIISPTSLESIDTSIRELIDSCEKSNEDPKGKQEFYLTVHRYLDAALKRNLISSIEEADALWVKYDQWADEAYQRLGESRVQRVQMANDPSSKVPLAARIKRKKKNSAKYFDNNLINRNQRLFLRRMEPMIMKIILSSTSHQTLAVREDLFTRVKFYQTWRQYVHPSQLPAINFFWNILLNRTPDYYQRNPLPVEYDNLQRPRPQNKRGRTSNYYASLDEFPRKRFSIDRIMKKLINSCIDLELDPRTTHKFYWAIHRCVQTQNNSHLKTETELLRKWKKYDELATEAFQSRNKFVVLDESLDSRLMDEEEYYEDVDELPPPPMRRLKQSQEEEHIPKPTERELIALLGSSVRDFVIKYSPNVTIRDDIKVRKEFFFSYVNLLSTDIDNSVIDQFWNRLLTESLEDYSSYLEEKQQAEAQPIAQVMSPAKVKESRSLKGRVRKRIVPFTPEVNIKSQRSPYPYKKSKSSYGYVKAQERQKWDGTKFLPIPKFPCQMETNDNQHQSSILNFPNISNPSMAFGSIKIEVNVDADHVMNLKEEPVDDNDAQYQFDGESKHSDEMKRYFNGIGNPFISDERHNHQSQRIHPECTVATSSIFAAKLCERGELPPPTSMESAENTVRKVIQSIVVSGQDPRCSQEFYFTIHRLLSSALEKHIIPPTRTRDDTVDAYWRMFDHWAKEASNCIDEPTRLEHCRSANDPLQKPPPWKTGKSKTKKSLNSKIAQKRVYKLFVRRMEACLCEFIMSFQHQNPNLPSIGDDLHCRVKFYTMWTRYTRDPSYQPALNYYWNLLMYRSPDYYTLHKAPYKYYQKLAITKLQIPPCKSQKPTNVKMNWKDQFSRKKFSVDRLVKNAINSCIDLGVDPRLTHKFHWTIYRALQTKLSVHRSISENELFREWRKYDSLATNAFLSQTKLPISNQGSSLGNVKEEYYEDANELPPPRPTAKSGPQMKTSNEKETLPKPDKRDLKALLDSHVRDLVLWHSDEIEILSDVKIRKEFLTFYVDLISPAIDDSWLDRFWIKLCTETRNNYQSYLEEKKRERKNLMRSPNEKLINHYELCISDSKGKLYS